MAELQLERAELVLHLSGAEKAEAVHGDLRVPRRYAGVPGARTGLTRGRAVRGAPHAWPAIEVPHVPRQTRYGSRHERYPLVLGCL